MLNRKKPLNILVYARNRLDFSFSNGGKNMKENPLYSLVPKKPGKGFSYRLKIAAGGNRGGLKSVDKIAGILGYEVPVVKRKDAANILDEWFALADEKAGQETNPNLYEYAKKVLTKDSPLYARLDARRKKTKKDPISLRYRKSCLHEIERYKKILSCYRLNGFKAKDLDNLIYRLIEDDDCSVVSINLLHQALRKVYDYAISQGITETNPARMIKFLTPPEAEREILNPVEMMKLISKIDDTNRIDWIEKLVYITTVYSGIRRGELLSLRVCDIHPTKDDQGNDSEDVYVIEVKRNWDYERRRFKSPKSGKPRNIYVWRDLGELLKFHFEEFGLRDQDLAFPLGKKKNEVNYTAMVFSKHLRDRLKELVGIDREEQKRRGISFHSLRHYYDTAMQNNAMDNEVRKDIMEAVGHESIRVDNMYIHESMFSKKLRLAKISGSLFNLKDFFPNGLPEHLLDEREKKVRLLKRNKHQMLLPNSEERNPSSVNV